MVIIVLASVLKSVIRGANEGSIALAISAGYPARELRIILRLARERQPELLEAWHELFGAG